MWSHKERMKQLHHGAVIRGDISESHRERNSNGRRSRQHSESVILEVFKK